MHNNHYLLSINAITEVLQVESSLYTRTSEIYILQVHIKEKSRLASYHITLLFRLEPLDPCTSDK